ncbi:hypothetical protein DPMN_124964 [Dreissena polymorpha]|uniref:Uncharacterized protein n=1 Tax=Dreissena polymorpha TaxID=45954 RepID=A0A9D4GU89_DREPO|nr:hypothetical protein DPMN_124964 [Dreissena polymorpha]
MSDTKTIDVAILTSIEPVPSNLERVIAVELIIVCVRRGKVGAAPRLVDQLRRLTRIRGLA